MLQEIGPLRPHAWVTGDDAMGRSSRFRAQRRRRDEPDLLAVPSNTTVGDLEGAVPEWSGRGPHPKRAFEPVRARSRARPAGAWRLSAGWFLVQESRRGGRGGTGPDGATGASRAGVVAAVGVPV